MLLVGSCSGRFHALDLATGADPWVYDTTADGPPVQFHGDALLAGGDRLDVGMLSGEVTALPIAQCTKGG